MKKLLIAAALTASVCSFGADAVAPINAQTFDGTDYALATDDYIVKADGDASAVTAYGGENLAASNKETEAGQVGANYLNLSTEGSTLWRTIGTSDATEMKAVADDGTYIDTLVQFTATEEDPTSFDTGAKLAMWLLKTGEGGSATYTLKVRGAAISKDPNEAATVIANPTSVALDCTVAPATWYRLTVKAVTVANAETGSPITAFAIYIDGNLVNPVTSLVAQDWIDYIKRLETSMEMAFFAFTNMDILKTSLIPSVTAGVVGDDTLYGVGFKGTGAIDSIAWTDKNIYPFSAPSAAFTLTIAMDEESIDSVTYTFGEGDAAVSATVKADTADIEVPANAVVKFTAVAKDWFTAPTIADITMTANTTTDEIKGIAVTASDITFADTTVPADAATAALAWAKNAGKTTDQVKAAKYFYSDYLLGFTDFSEAEPTIEIVSIDFDANGKPVVEAKVTVDGVTKIEKLSTATLNGTLKYKAAATLEALKTATPKAAIKKGGQFIQVVVE